MLVKFDETDFNGFKINVPTHKELDVLHSHSDGNYAVESSFSSEYESTDWISGTDHGDAQSLNKSPRLKRKRVKTKRVTVLAKLPAISTSNIVNKSNQESNIEGNLVVNWDFKCNRIMVYMSLTCINYSRNRISSNSWLDISSWNSS